MMQMYVIAAVVAALISFAGAWKVQDWRYHAKDAARIEKENENKRINEKAATAAATNFEKDKLKNDKLAKTIYVEVEKIVDRPVYRNQCFDADGLLLLNQQIKAGGNSGQPEGAVPGTGHPQ